MIAYGKGGEIASNRRDEQEMFVLCLRILQSALVLVNTLMLQDVLGDPKWADLLTPADLRGLTPLFWSHVRLYDEVRLTTTSRLPLSTSRPVSGWRSPTYAACEPAGVSRSPGTQRREIPGRPKTAPIRRRALSAWSRT
ncbi:Tn3 family transposase [Streptomyces sp. NPDC006173]|uniref:Tn3 family transposase n=1 Tax=Streptomyces sp. NPDC006173 TaxID=3155349 RepID=UPI0033E5A7B3